MTIIYLHGLDADPNANKAVITANHAKALGIDTLRPDLNCPPDEVVAKLLNLIKENPQYRAGWLIAGRLFCHAVVRHDRHALCAVKPKHSPRCVVQTLFK